MNTWENVCVIKGRIFFKELIFSISCVRMLRLYKCMCTIYGSAAQGWKKAMNLLDLESLVVLSGCVGAGTKTKSSERPESSLNWLSCRSSPKAEESEPKGEAKKRWNKEVFNFMKN